MPCQTRGTVAAESEGAAPVPVREESSGSLARGLLLAKHRVLQALGETELADALRGDLDGLARLRVPPDARLAVRQHELAEAREDELAALLRLPARELQRLVQDALDLRSEEHTSELQSHLNLVCRLLLEKKNK